MDERIEKLLETYSFEEILEYNDITPSYVLQILYMEGVIVLPPEPC